MNVDIELKETFQRAIILLKQWRVRESSPRNENLSYRLFRVHAMQAEIYAQRALKELHALNSEWPAPDSIFFEE